MTDRELGALEGLEPAEANRYATAVFGAKEAVYKVVNPLGRQALGFFDVEILWESTGRFRVTFVGENGDSVFGDIEGVVSFSERMVWSLCWIPRPNVSALPL